MRKKRPRNIIVIVADSLRFDSFFRASIPIPRYFVEKGIGFTRMRSAGCWTLPSTAAFFTGVMPHEHGATSQTRAMKKEYPTLAEKLSAIGYSTYQITANVATTGVFKLHRGFDRIYKAWELLVPVFKKSSRFLMLLSKPRIRRILFSENRDKVQSKLSRDLKVGNCWFQSTENVIFDKARSILESNEKKGKGSFLFLNLMETHFPYHVDSRFSLTGENLLEKWNEINGLIHTVNQSFLKDDGKFLEPEILERLKRRQYRSWGLIAPALEEFIKELHKDKDNLVVFCSDHGDNFGEQNWIYHFSNVSDAGTRIPCYWFDHEHAGGKMLDHGVSSRYLYNSILDSCGLDTQGPTIFSESSENLPIMESYWYNNQEKTQPKYKYNQFCFIQNKRRYVKRNDRWYTAPEENGTPGEPLFEEMGGSCDPLFECIDDIKRRDFLRNQLDGFDTFERTLRPGAGNNEE
jgi:hypothetical protein